MIALIILALLIIAAIIVVIAMVVNSYWNSDDESFIGWAKEEIRFNKEFNDGWKAKENYLKTHPLCIECLKRGDYIKASHVAYDNNKIISLCKEHYIMYDPRRVKRADI